MDTRTVEIEVEVTHYAEKPSAESKETQTPVEYIGLVAPSISDFVVGKASLRLLLYKTQQNPSSLEFAIAEAKGKDVLISALAEKSLNAGCWPVVHIFECYKSTESLFPNGINHKDMHNYLSQIIQDYPAKALGYRLPFTVKSAQKLNETKTDLTANSVFAQKETGSISETKENNSEATKSVTPNATPSVTTRAP